MRTLVSGDVQYLEFYLKDKDLTTGEETYHTLAGASVTLRLRWYGETTNVIEVGCNIVNDTLGYVRALVTIPTVSTPKDMHGEIEVTQSGQILTWKDIFYRIVPQLD